MKLFGKVFSVFISLILVVFLYGCSVSPLQERTENLSLPYEEIKQSSLYSSVENLSQNNNNLSGVYPLENALEAFLSRILLVKNAEKTLDVQYYIWRSDNTGILLFNEILLAADRGVRVRILLDDLGSYGLDNWTAMMNSHPNIEVRLFNPFYSRKTRVFDFITNFNQANRRMHNKSFTADQAVTIVGGRNIGDEYFAATDGVLFSDLDVVVLGDIAEEVSSDFDGYWVSQSAYPVEQLFKPKVEKNVLLKQVNTVFRKPEALSYVMALQEAYYESEFNTRNLPIEWVNMRLISDSPVKGLGISKESDLFIYRLEQMIDKKVNKLDLVSPYFVPAKKGTETFTQLASEGAKIRILTNAQEATDVIAVHSGYMKRRKDLLQAGIEIFEMKSQSDNVEEPKGSGVFSSSGSSLHAKTFAINNQQLFVGSYNFDPRSARLNTELGLLIDSPALAKRLNTVFTEKIQATSYKVSLNNKGKLLWEERLANNKTLIHNKEPKTSWFQRTAVRFLSWLPIDWLL